MPQSLNQKAVNNFVRGLITEAAELTFPEGASVDELNCDLRRDGTRRRRLGVALEDNYSLSSFTISNTEKISTGTWVNVGGNSELEFLVLQKGSTLYFYNKADLPHSAQIEANSVNLASYEFAGSAGAETAKCQFASLNGLLVVSSNAIDTIAIEYDAGTFTVTQIDFRTRDFDYQGSINGDPTYFEFYDRSVEGVDAPIGRQYDTLNSGWASENNGHAGHTALSYYQSAKGTGDHPPLTHPWFSGKNSTDQQNVAEWEKIDAGTSLSGNGHYILDFFNKDRNAASGLTGLTTETESSRFKSVVAFGGRIFYAGLDSAKNAGTILFSRIIDTTSDLGICYQRNDPTAEYLSDLLDNDGGVIKIPDAVNIQRLYAFQSSIFVFAENGVWQITGVDGVFKATVFSINFISPVGIVNPQSFVEAEGLPFWWSRYGIHTLQVDPVSGQGTEQNLSIPTIQTLWDKIDSNAKSKTVAAYDRINKRIFWGYPDNDETIESKLNNFLILDIPLQAFYPWKVSDQTSSTSSIVGMAFYSGFGATELELDVTANNGVDDVVNYTLTPISSIDLTFTAYSTDVTVLVYSSGHSVQVGDYVGFSHFTETFDQTGIGVFPILTPTLFNNNTYQVTSVTANDFELTITAPTPAESSVTFSDVFTTYGYYYNTSQSIQDDVVSTQISTFNIGDPAIVLLVRNGADNKLTMAGFTNTGFQDWGDTDYSSYAETGYDFLGDLTRHKNTPYLISYCRLTEEGFTGTEEEGYEAIRPSSLKVSTAWDFKDTFSAPQQAYRLKYPVVPNPSDLSIYDYPEDVVTTRLKIRGNGRSMRIKYESEAGKDFVLLGWGLITATNPRI